MKYSTSKIPDIVKLCKSGNKAIHFVMTESSFMWDQLVAHLAKNFGEVEALSSWEQVKNLRSGLFSEKIVSVPFHKDMIEGLMAVKLQATVIVQMKEKDDNGGKQKLNYHWIEDYPIEKIGAAFNAWLAARTINADPAAIAYGVKQLPTDELKSLLYFIGLRDDGFVSLPAIQHELEHYEASIFNLHDALLSAHKVAIHKRFTEIIASNPPHKILASLTTLNRNILFAVQAKKQGANANQLSERCEISYGAARAALEKISTTPNFSEVRAVNLQTCLAALNLKLVRTTPQIKMESTMLHEFYRYICSVGYLGA